MWGDSLANAIVRAHMRYARWLNRWHGWSGHLWATDSSRRRWTKRTCGSAIRYIEQNPVRAKLAKCCEDYPWSSTQGNGNMRADLLLSPGRPFTGQGPEWLDIVNVHLPLETVEELRRNTLTGRPSGVRSS